MDELILVDTRDQVVGHGEKLQVHREGLLHRAFSVFLVHDGKMLLHRRAEGKYHSGGLWTNACCSHPRRGEELSEAVERRLKEELGVSCPCEERFHFVYRAPFPGGITEYEYDHVFLGDYWGELRPDPEEIAACRWVEFSVLRDQLLRTPEVFTPWFLIAAPGVLEIVDGDG